MVTQAEEMARILAQFRQLGEVFTRFALLQAEAIRVFAQGVTNAVNAAAVPDPYASDPDGDVGPTDYYDAPGPFEDAEDR